MQKHKGPHRYVKVKWGKNKTPVFKCALPGCTHYVHPQMIEGRASLCNICGAEFVMNPDKARRVRPKCDACQFKRGGKEGSDVAERLDSLLKDL